MYTPFDRNLDKTYEAALVLTEERKRGTRTSKPQILDSLAYAFHKRYVEDVSDMIKGEKNPKAQMDLVKQKFSKDKNKSGLKGLRFTKFPQYGVAYVIPQAKDDGQKRKSLLLRLARSVVLSNLDNLIVLQETENEKLKTR